MYLAFAWWSVDLLAGFNPTGDIPIQTDNSWDWRDGVHLRGGVAGVVTGLVPACGRRN